MKIAREIREMLESMGVIQHGLLDPEYDTQRIDERIAAELMPVRDALLMMWDEPTMSAVDMIEKYEAAIAMLSEEEPCIPDQSQKTA